MDGCSLLSLRHAIENASNTRVTDTMIIAMLQGQGGSDPHLRALFEDSTLQALARGAASIGITLDTVLAAYAAAKDTVAAINPELDEILKAD